MSAGASVIAALAPLPSAPGFAGFFSACGTGSFISAPSRRREGRRTRWIEDVPDPAGVLAGIASAHRVELRGDAVAGAEQHLAVADARLEAVERADGRAADHLALEVVDAAVAGADEVARRGDEVHWATDVRAAAGDRDVAVRVLVEGRLRNAPADESGRLARLTDPRHQREDDRFVGVTREAAGGADALPALLWAV